MEEWRDLRQEPNGYMISSHGRIVAKRKIDARGWLRKQRNLIPSRTEDGYLRACLVINGKPKHIAIHRLVFETFIDDIPKGYEINHLNGVRDDNRVENLEAITHSENVKYSKNVLKANYATFGNGRMTKEERDQIFELRKQGKTGPEIGRIMGFSKAQIYNVLNMKCWITHH